jgi:acyl dehydratase
VSESRKAVYYDDLHVGMVMESPSRTISTEELETYMELIQSQSSLHKDTGEAQKFGFKLPFLPGPLLAGISVPLLEHRYGEIRIIALLEVRQRFLAPAYPGDALRYVSRVALCRPSSKPGRGVVTLEEVMLNSTDQHVMEQTRVALWEMRPRTEPS